MHEDGISLDAPRLVILAGAEGALFWRPKTGIRRAIAARSRPQRARGHGELRWPRINQAVWAVNGGLPVFLVTYGQELYAGPRTDVVHARDARDRRCDGARLGSRRHLRRDGVRRFAADPRDRHPARARRATDRAETDVRATTLYARVAIGVVVGLVAAFALTRLMSSLLFGVTALDPVTYTAVSALLIVAGVLASYLPARGAIAIDPVQAMRADKIIQNGKTVSGHCTGINPDHGSGGDSLELHAPTFRVIPYRYQPSLTLANESVSYGWQATRRLSTVARSAKVDGPVQPAGSANRAPCIPWKRNL